MHGVPVCLYVYLPIYVDNSTYKMYTANREQNTVFPRDNRDYKPITKAKNYKATITISNLCSILDNHSTTEICRQHSICLKNIYIKIIIDLTLK